MRPCQVAHSYKGACKRVGKSVIRERQVFRVHDFSSDVFPTLLLGLPGHGWRVVGCVDREKSVREIGVEHFADRDSGTATSS
jgi:hypothetical protein